MIEVRTDGNRLRVQSKLVLTQNIKKVVRKALSCEKVNVYTVDVMRQVLPAVHLESVL